MTSFPHPHSFAPTTSLCSLTSVGHKLLDAGNSDHPSAYEAIPVGETRIALLRSFVSQRLQLA
jgi:hypothetical protein